MDDRIDQHVVAGHRRARRRGDPVRAGGVVRRRELRVGVRVVVREDTHLARGAGVIVGAARVVVEDDAVDDIAAAAVADARIGVGGLGRLGMLDADAALVPAHHDAVVDLPVRAAAQVDAVRRGRPAAVRVDQGQVRHHRIRTAGRVVVEFVVVRLDRLVRSAVAPLLDDRELAAAAEAHLPVQAVVQATHADQVLAGDRAAEPLEEIVGTAEGVAVLDPRVGADRVPGEGVQLVVRRDLVPCVLDPDVAQDAAVVAVIGPAVQNLRALGDAALATQAVGAVGDAVAADHQSAVVTGSHAARRLVAGEDDRSARRALGVDLRAPLDAEEADGRLLTEDHGSRLDRQGGRRHDPHLADQEVVVRADPGRVRRDVARDIHQRLAVVDVGPAGAVEVVVDPADGPVITLGDRRDGAAVADGLQVRTAAILTALGGVMDDVDDIVDPAKSRAAVARDELRVLVVRLPDQAVRVAVRIQQHRVDFEVVMGEDRNSGLRAGIVVGAVTDAAGVVVEDHAVHDIAGQDGGRDGQ